ncbi:hypothetical protein [Mammaliicoccus lentus]|uniref:hypothetical protein n=1 Tax=Mammaliicoccus lentus TaxID=42858 RepID=UPI0010718A81|nr:hypothetical protein [Mammaliicoccus lentus]MBF0749191.1 hypothetical protein [Mammaliicoccus lentus]TFU57869.1 hypothetical protein E4T93_07235 [Mammaliicoccus lentus]
MKIDFTDEEIAIIYDSLYHVESTTDVYSNPYGSDIKEKYNDAFASTFLKIKEITSNKEKGIFYFE